VLPTLFWQIEEKVINKKKNIIKEEEQLHVTINGAD